MALLPTRQRARAPERVGKIADAPCPLRTARHAILPTLRIRFILTAAPYARSCAPCADRSSVRPTYDAHEFFNLATLVGFVARVDRTFDTVRHVISENFLLDASQCCSNGGDLRDDVDTVAVF